MIDEMVLIEKVEGYEGKVKLNFGNRGDFEFMEVEAVKDIANQLAEESNLTPCYLGSPCEYQNEDAKMPMEYWNNGWIPCSERLPKIGTLVLATTESENVCDDVLIYDYEHSKSKEPCFHRWDDEMWECYTPRVIAWQPLPAPFKPKE